MHDTEIHYEVFARRTPASGWTLELATESRAKAIEAAEQMLADGDAAGVKVLKETLDPHTREYRSVPVLTRGATELPKAKRERADNGPICAGPTDLYTAHAREKIGRLLDGWLVRNRVTPFELLHRPDLVEQLDASGMEIQSAIQKIAIPESQATGAPVHELIRTFQKLVERAIERLLTDARRAKFPDIGKAGFAETATTLAADHDRVYKLGAGVAAFVGEGLTWNAKIGRILDLADRAPPEGRARGLAFHVLEQPLGEIVAVSGGLSDLAGPGLDLGGSLAFLIRLVAAPEVADLFRAEPGLEAQFPQLTPEAERLARWLEREEFRAVRTALARRVLKELNGPRRLRPASTDGEIAVLRALAMAMTATDGRLLRPEDVQAAFVERSSSLTTADFVGAYVANAGSAMNEARALVRLAENVVGRANKRAAARWITSCIGALRFEKEVREAPEGPASKLAALAELQQALSRCRLADEDRTVIADKLGEIGGVIEADSKLTLLLGKASAPAQQRLTALLQLARGETAPYGPATDRARAEAVRLLREPEVRGQLAACPDLLGQVKTLIGAGDLAAA